MSEMKLTDIKKYTEAIQWRDWDTCEIIAEEHKTLIDRIKELEQKLALAEGEWKAYYKANQDLSSKLSVAVEALERCTLPNCIADHYELTAMAALNKINR